MTDLKPEDLERVERLLARAIVAANSSAPVETHLGLACEFIGAREDFLSLLADRARMEKALRETTDALLNAAAALEQLQESSENGAESIKTIGSADPGVTVHMFGLLADSARRAAKCAREGASQ